MVRPPGHRRGGGSLLAFALAAVGVLVAAGARGPDLAVIADGGPYLPVQQVPPGFTHGDHEALQCFTCHENRDGHGALIVTTIEDCRSCHHDPSVARSCESCHVDGGTPTTSFSVVRPLRLTVGGGDTQRSFAFPHERHDGLACAGCHTEGSALAVSATLECSSCHQDHHAPDSECASCHAPVHAAAHPPAQVHVTCAGAACHQDVPFASVPRTRAFCLGCHREMSFHQAPRDCVACHILPSPRAP